MASEPTTDLQTRSRPTVEREGTRPGLVFRPDVDIVERKDGFVVTADLPGVDEGHVQVKLEDGVLSIEADLATEPEEAWQPLYAEYRSGGYYREFRLSDAIDADRIQASMRDGVLQLHLPKTERHRPRQITVQAS
jgi:HSP20 family molecular chaperone IbpA